MTLLLSAAATAADPNSGKALYEPCVACHGANGKGNDALNSPKLTGIGDAYMLRQVQAFQKGYRGTHADDKFGKQMKMMSTLVSDKELNDLAAYLNEQTEAQ